MAPRSLAGLFPPPRTVALAGRAFLVEELTVGDLAEVHAAAEAGAPDPLGPVRGLLGAASVPPSERHRFARALDLARGEGEDEGGEPGDVRAVRELLALVRAGLRRHHPDVAGDDGVMLDLIEAMTAAEYLSLREATYRPDPFLVLCREVDRLSGTAGDDAGDGPDWFELVDAVARSHSIPYAAVREMTLAQFRNALSEGKARSGRAPREGEDPLATDRAWKRWLSGEDD